MKNRITVRLTDEAVCGLEAMRQQLRLRGISELVREAVDLLLASDQPQLARELVEEFKAMRKDLHGVGNNLNQVAYRLNANHPLSSPRLLETVDELGASFKKMAMAMKRMRDDLGL